MKLAVKTEPNKTKLEIITKIGYKAVEVYTAKKFISQEYIDLLKRFPLEYAIHAPIDFCDDSIVNFAKQLNSKIITIHGTYNAAELSVICEKAKSESIFLCLENEGTWGENNYDVDIEKPANLVTIYSADNFRNILQRFPDLSVTLDFEHADIRQSRESFYPLIESGHVKHTHISGYNGKGTWHTPPLDCEPRFREIIKRLKSINYQGMLTIEMATKDQNEEVLTRHFEYFSNI